MRNTRRAAPRSWQMVTFGRDWASRKTPDPQQEGVTGPRNFRGAGTPTLAMNRIPDLGMRPRLSELRSRRIAPAGERQRQCSLGSTPIVRGPAVLPAQQRWLY